jgi:acyl-CoA thioesterase-1
MLHSIQFRYLFKRCSTTQHLIQGVPLAQKAFALIVILCLALFSSVSMAQAKRILILGDSLSAGYGIEVAESWPSLLQQKFDKAQKNIQVINASISGQTSVEGRSQIDRLLEIHQPSLLILELGANDGLRGLSLTEMKQNLSAIITSAQSRDAKVLLLGMRVPTNYGRRYTQMFYNTFSQLAEEHQTQFIPFMLAPLFTETGLSDPEFIQSDGLHPTAKAQPLIVDHLWEEIAGGL